MKVYAATACTGHQTETLSEVKVYIARSGGGNNLHVEVSGGYPRMLVSYAYDRSDVFRGRLRKFGFDPAASDFLLDSGAFTVWASGGTVDLDAYIAWVKSWQSEAPTSRPINLDVIPSEHGGPPPPKRERDKAIRTSEKNADYIREAGLAVMEVYHWHEPLAVLDHLLDRRTPGMPVGIGGVAGPGSQPDKRTFVDGVFAHIRGRVGGWDGIPPLHGLGIAPESPLGRRYPWASLDANSWVYPHRMGQPVSRDGRRGKTASDSRTSNTDVATIYMQRVLQRWLRLEAEMTELWRARGVRVLD